MLVQLIKLSKEDTPAFKKMFQEAFQKGFEDYFGKEEGTILPEKDIDWSLNSKGAHAYKAMLSNEMVGGVIVQINDNDINELHLLCVKVGTQSKGIGRDIWFQIEKMFPNTKKWCTCTPIFEKRNVHFYTEVCGFKIVKEVKELEDAPADFIGDAGQGMYEFEKVMK